MFKGSSFHIMDNKGRVSIPVRYREILQESQDRQLILTNWDGYILAFPQSEWVKVEAKLGELALFRKDYRAFQRFLISGVEECPLDRQGRILIPQSLREYAKLGREVAIVGLVRNFEIWDRQRYEAHRKQLEESIDESVLHELLI
jgi:MraZ protein|uniref:Transcriptional regulator MraZ n=1 Tax=Desulfobacca acetoxidans TaxID=60893 RepID=A0A7C3V0U8_9BACT